MTLQIINSTTAGATQDLSTRVFMASERLNLPPFSITQNAEEGSVAHSTLVVDDNDSTLTLKGHRRVYFVETSAPTGQQVIGNTYIGTKTITRGDWVVGPLARTFSVQLADQNTLISRRLMVGADANRPAETDVARVQWLMGTTEANEFNGSSTYISTTGPVAMDAVNYQGQSVTQILSDCSQASGKNWWVIYEESLGEFSLWYDFHTSQFYTSAIRLSNDEVDIDDLVTFAYFPTAEMTEDPSRVYSGTLIDFQPANTETTTWIYETQISTGNEFVFRDVAYPSVNVKTETKARARAVRYNADSDEEDIVFNVSFVVPSAQVNDLMHGMSINIKGTHWTGYTDFASTRCLKRTVTQLSSTHYRIDAELTPIPQVPGVDQYYTSTNLSGCEVGTWPEGSPGAGRLLVGFLAQRDGSTHDATIVPIGNGVSPGSETCDAIQDIAGTGWTFIDNLSITNGAGQTGQLTLVRRNSVAGEPEVIRWGGAGGLAGTSRPRSHQVAISNLSGAPTVTQKGTCSMGAVMTSPNITVGAAGYIFAGFLYRCTGPGDGASASFTLTSRSPAVDLTKGFQFASFGGYSWFGYLQVDGAGTYNIVVDRSNAPRDSYAAGWVMGFWPS